MPFETRFSQLETQLSPCQRAPENLRPAPFTQIRYTLSRTQDMTMNREKRTEIFTRLRDQNPHPTTELEYSSDFELLVAVVLSAQATDVGVNKATAKLYPVANTPEAIYALGLDGLKQYIKTIGLFNSKAENVIQLCKILIEQHDRVWLATNCFR